MITKNSPYRALEDFKSTLENFKISEVFDWNFVTNKHNFIRKYAKTNMILILGSNPSTASPSIKAFESTTKSKYVVDSWFRNCEENYYLFYENIYNYPTPNNRPLNHSELMSIIPTLNHKLQTYEDYGCKIVACGNQVRDVLNKVKVEHFPMPHPSGSNRFWNNKEAGATKIKEMREWINKERTT